MNFFKKKPVDTQKNVPLSSLTPRERKDFEREAQLTEAEIEKIREQARKAVENPLSSWNKL